MAQIPQCTIPVDMQFQQGLYGVYLDEDPALPDAPYIYLYVADADFFFLQIVITKVSCGRRAKPTRSMRIRFCEFEAYLSTSTVLAIAVSLPTWPMTSVRLRSSAAASLREGYHTTTITLFLVVDHRN